MIRGAGYIANRWIRYSPWIEREEVLSTAHITTAHALSYRWAVHRAPLAPHHHRGHGRLPQAPATLPRPHIQERTTGVVRLYHRRHPLPAVFRAQVNPWARANPRCGYGLGPRGLWGRFYTQAAPGVRAGASSEIRGSTRCGGIPALRIGEKEIRARGRTCHAGPTWWWHRSQPLARLVWSRPVGPTRKRPRKYRKRKGVEWAARDEMWRWARSEGRGLD
jgi:hypothetical protein